MNVAEEFGRIETAYQGFKRMCRTLRSCAPLQLGEAASEVLIFLTCGRVGWRGIGDATNASLSLIGSL
jgi:hypothetical protein